MAVDIQAEVTRQDVADLAKVMQRLQDETGRSTDDAVSYAALKIAESGRSASKTGKKNRDIVVNPEWTKENQKIYNWAKRQRKQGKAIPADWEGTLQSITKAAPLLIERLSQRKGTILIPAWERKDLRRVIERRGLAKQVWGVMVGKMGALQGAKTANASGPDYRVTKYKEALGEPSTVVRLVNKLSYLEKAYPGIRATAIINGTTALKRMLDQKIQRAAERANKGK